MLSGILLKQTYNDICIHLPKRMSMGPTGHHAPSCPTERTTLDQHTGQLRVPTSASVVAVLPAAEAVSNAASVHQGRPSHKFRDGPA